MREVYEEIGLYLPPERFEFIVSCLGQIIERRSAHVMLKCSLRVACRSTDWL